MHHNDDLLIEIFKVFRSLCGDRESNAEFLAEVRGKVLVKVLPKKF